MSLNNEDKKILESLSVPALRFLSKIAEDKDFSEFKKLIGVLVDYEKNRTFGLAENEKLLIEHAYARGRVSSYIQTATLMLSARGEIERREQKRKEAMEKSRNK